MIRVLHANPAAGGNGRGRDAPLSFSRHKLVKGPFAATRGGDINCLPGDMTLDRLFRGGLTLAAEDLRAWGCFPLATGSCYQAEVV